MFCLARIAPLDGIGPDQLTIDAIDRPSSRRQLYRNHYGDQPYGRRETVPRSIHFQFAERVPGPDVTRLARGITAGSVLEYANREMIADATDWVDRICDAKVEAFESDLRT